MSKQYFDGKIDCGGLAGEFDEAFTESIDALSDRLDAEIEKLSINRALEEIFAVIDKANKYIDNTRPWVLAKSEEDKPRLNRVL